MGVKITLIIENCAKCPFHEVHQIVTPDSFEHEFGIYCTKVDDHEDSFERYTYDGRIEKRLVVADDRDPELFSKVPSWCPIIAQQLQELIEGITNSQVWKDTMGIITANPFGMKKLIIDHGLSHADRVVNNALQFLYDLKEHEFNDFVYHESLRDTERDQYLVTIAALLHDISLSTNEEDHAVKSAEMATKRFLSEADIPDVDKDIITDAIRRHSNGDHLAEDFEILKIKSKEVMRKAILDTDLAVPIALYLADKLDVTKERLEHEGNPGCTDPRFDDLVTAVKKIHKTEFRLIDRGKGENGRQLPTVAAELHYFVDKDFDPQGLSLWPKCIEVPLDVAINILGLKVFKFFVNNKEVDINQILKNRKR